MIEDNDEAKSVISGTLTGLFFKSTSGAQKCARGGLVSDNLTNVAKSHGSISDWFWAECSLGPGIEETRECTKLHLNTKPQQVDLKIHKKPPSPTVAVRTILSCMNVIYQEYLVRFGHV